MGAKDQKSEHKFMEGKNGGGYLRAQEKRESYTPLLFRWLVHRAWSCVGRL